MKEKTQTFLNGFTVRGAGADSFSKTPPVLRKMLAYLDALPFKEVITSMALARALGLAMDTVNKYAPWPEVADYRHRRSSGGNLYGSKRTIQELRKQLARQQEAE